MEIVARVREWCARRPVQLCILFGSQAAGRSHPHSDVDLALWPNEPLAAEVKLRWLGELQSHLDSDVSLVFVSSNIDPVLGMEIVRHGVPIFEASPEAWFEKRLDRSGPEGDQETEHQSTWATSTRTSRTRFSSGMNTADSTPFRPLQQRVLPAAQSGRASHRPAQAIATHRDRLRKARRQLRRGGDHCRHRPVVFVCIHTVAEDKASLKRPAAPQNAGGQQQEEGQPNLQELSWNTPLPPAAVVRETERHIASHIRATFRREWRPSSKNALVAWGQGCVTS